MVFLDDILGHVHNLVAVEVSKREAGVAQMVLDRVLVAVGPAAQGRYAPFGVVNGFQGQAPAASVGSVFEPVGIVLRIQDTAPRLPNTM